MEQRKNPKLDLEKRKSLHFNIGLAISMVLVLSAFEWRSEIEKMGFPTDILDAESVFIEIDPPLTSIPPPPKPIVVQPIITPVPDDHEIEKVVVVLDPDEISIDEPMVYIPEPAVEEAPSVFDIVEKSPEPIGGMSAFYKFLGKNIKYPRQARRIGIKGRVFVQFIVDEHGAITQVKTIKGIGGGCDEEAERILSMSPKWNPGKQRGRAVKVRMIVPVVFSLN